MPHHPPKIITITSDQGESRTYTIPPLPAGVGFGLAPRLLRMAAPLAQAMQAFTSGGTRAKAHGEGDALDELEEAASSLDGTLLAQAIQGVAVGLIEEGGSKIAQQLLASTTVEVEGEAKKYAPGLKPGDFDLLYAANYGELIQALAEVIRLNYSGIFRNLFKGIDPLAVARNLRAGMQR